MTTKRNDGRARAVLVLLVLVGLGLLAIPYFLTPPAFLELVLLDSVFASDLTGKVARVTEEESGSALAGMIAKVENGSNFARVGRILSGANRPFTVEVEGYKAATFTVTAPPVRTVRAIVKLIPTFGRLEVTLVNATLKGQPVSGLVKSAGALVSPEAQSVVVLNLPAGKHRLSAEASGFCPGEREFQVEVGKTLRTKFPVSPDLTGNEIARFILNWGENPRDIDAHFRKLGTSGGSNPAHVYFHHMEGTEEGGVFARLDVDHQNSEGYETVTVYDRASGDYEYWVNLYAGEGTLGGSAAQVEAFTRGCQRRQYNVPPGCAQKIWEVTHVKVKSPIVSFADLQKCIDGSPTELGRK